VATPSDATNSAFATNRMKKPNSLVTLSLVNAIESGKTLIGQLGEESTKQIIEGNA